MALRRWAAATTARVLLTESCAPRRYGVSAWAAPSAAAAPWAVGTGGAAGLLRPPLGLLPNGARGAKTEASKVSPLSQSVPQTPCSCRTCWGLLLCCG